MNKYTDIEDYLRTNNPSRRSSSLYDLSMEFNYLSIHDKITYSFGDAHAGASFKYNSNGYVIKNGKFFVIKNCIFKKEVIISINNPRDHIRFINCTFEKSLEINSYTPTKLDNLSTFSIEGGTINEFRINNVTANYRFYINKQYDGNRKTTNIKKLQIKDTIFKENFKLHKCIVEKVNIQDTDFEKNADFYNTHFINGFYIENGKEKLGYIYFKALNFSKLALFGDTTFEKEFSLKYVTIEGYSHFRNAEFKEGLNLDYTNIQNEINFFGAKDLDTDISKENTSQETYRIVKHNFEQLGNKIEANKYHSLELDQKRRKLESEKSRKWQEYLVFKLHDLSSEHSTNWLLALLWIVIVGFTSTILTKEPWFLLVFPMTYLLANVCFKQLTSKLWFFIFVFSVLLFFDNNLKLKSVMDYMAIINLTNSDFILIKNYNKDNLLGTWDAVVLFLNKISLGYLYYQFLMSVRKDTRK